MEGQLTRLAAHGDPAALDVGEVVEEDPRHGDGAQVLHVRGLGHLAFPGRVATLEGPGGEGGVAAAVGAGQGPVLLVPQGRQVLDALRQGLGDAEHHGARGLHALFVGRLHDLQPLVAVALQGGDLLADAVHQDLGAPAGDGAQARIPQVGDGLPQVLAAELGHHLDLHRREAVDPDALLVAEEAHQIQVVVPGQVRVHPALQQEASATDGAGLRSLLGQLLPGEHIAAAVAGPVVEGAEGAVDVADVRVVDVAVDDIAGPGRVVVAVPEGRGSHRQVRQLRLLQQHHGLIGSDAAASKRTFEDRLGRQEPCCHAWAL